MSSQSGLVQERFSPISLARDPGFGPTFPHPRERRAAEVFDCLSYDEPEEEEEEL